MKPTSSKTNVDSSLTETKKSPVKKTQSSPVRQRFFNAAIRRSIECPPMALRIANARFINAPNGAGPSADGTPLKRRHEVATKTEAGTPKRSREVAIVRRLVVDSLEDIERALNRPESAAPVRDDDPILRAPKKRRSAARRIQRPTQ